MNMKMKPELTDSHILGQRLRSEKGERSALEHQIFLADRHLDPPLQYKYKIINRFTLLIDN